MQRFYSECLVSILQLTEHFLWIFDNSNVNNDKLTNDTNFRDQKQNNVVYQLPNEYWVSWIAYVIMPEYLKYCTQLTEYWLNKSAYLNVV